MLRTEATRVHILAAHQLSHVAHTNESCRTYEGVMSHTYERVMSHTEATRVHILAVHQPSHVSLCRVYVIPTTESCHTSFHIYERVMSHS